MEASSARLPPIPGGVGDDSLLRKYRIYPRMARWFNPVLLAKLLNNVIVSSRFSQYADRRLIVAALDTQTPEKLFRERRET